MCVQMGGSVSLCLYHVAGLISELLYGYFTLANCEVEMMEVLSKLVSRFGPPKCSECTSDHLETVGPERGFWSRAYTPCLMALALWATPKGPHICIYAHGPHSPKCSSDYNKTKEPTHLEEVQ